MADTPPATAKPSGSTFGFLGKKVFGKVPVWVIAVGAVGGYYAWKHYGPGKKAGAAMQTDPAGNTCATFGPTGYCPGTPEEAAALAAASTSGGTDTTGMTGTGTADTSGGAAGTGQDGAGGATGNTGTSPPPATTGAPPPPTVIPAAPPPPAHANAHAAHVAHEAHLNEERIDRAQAARAAHSAHVAHLAHSKKKGAKR